MNLFLTPQEVAELTGIARGRDKGGDMDIEKSAHTLEGWLKLKNNVEVSGYGTVSAVTHSYAAAAERQDTK